MVRSLVVLGTRPEVVKLAPVIRRLRADPRCHHVSVLVTGQHRELLDQALAAFDLRADVRLRTMRPNQSLADSAARILSGVAGAIARLQPDVVIVQGDTTTTFYGALAAFYARVPVAHVEAGLRTGARGLPFPEEAHRTLTARLADLHFPATAGAAGNLLVEGVDAATIVTTGNTSIDAVVDVAERLNSGRAPVPRFPWRNPERRLLLLTAHRRESFGRGFESICEAAARLARREDVEIVCPVHPNPNVRTVVEARLSRLPGVHLIDPAGYVEFVSLMREAHVILTDSGGVQEEAPALGTPVLVLRESTERPEAVEAGAARLTGLDPSRIVQETELLLDDPVEYAARAQPRFPFGDGRAADRIAAALVRFDRGLSLAAAG